MKKIVCTLVLVSYSICIVAQNDSIKQVLEERNKQLARNFYEDLWFNNRTEKYAKYMGKEYVVHDIGGGEGIIEPGIRQKEIADRFWNGGELSGIIDYQIAEGDLVATRWRWTNKPTTFMARLFEAENLPIINVFRFNEEGKIVEIWNHRHDIDTNQTLVFTIKGFLFGLVLAIIPIFITFRYKRKLKRINSSIQP